MLLGFAGLAVLVLVGGGSVGGFPVGPALLVMFAVDLLGVRLLRPAAAVAAAGRRSSRRVYEMLFGGLLLLTVGAALGRVVHRRRLQRAHLERPGLPRRVRLGGRVHVLRLAARERADLVRATYAYVNPVVAVFLGWLVLGEPVTWAVVGGAGSWSRGGPGDLGRATPAPYGRGGDAPVPAAVAGEPGPVDEVCADDATRSRG